MNHWIIKARYEEKDGSGGVLSCKFSERESETTSVAECRFRLEMEADHAGVKIVGPVEVFKDWRTHAARDAERAARVGQRDGRRVRGLGEMR